MAAAHNLLVLDEPSNHLDIPSAERLEQALSSAGGYEGTLILVTHDRALIEATCDQLLVLDGNGGARHFQGRYSQWAERDAAGRSPAPVGIATDVAPPQRRRKKKPAAGGGSAVQRVSIDRLEKQIEQTEHRIGEIDGLLVDPAVYTDGNRCRDLQAEREKLSKALRPLEDEWARRAADGNSGTAERA